MSIIELTSSQGNEKERRKRQRRKQGGEKGTREKGRQGRRDGWGERALTNLVFPGQRAPLNELSQ